MLRHWRMTGISAAAVAASLMLVGFVAHAQNPNQINREAQMNRDNQLNRETGHNFKASELLGLSVRTTANEEKGKIKDLVISPDGRIDYAAVSFGGFLGIGDKLFAVPLDAIHLQWKDNKLDHGRVDVTEETIKQRQGFDENHWPEHADRGFLMGQTSLPVERNPNR